MIIVVTKNGILTDNVNWANGHLLSVGGNIAIDGIFDYNSGNLPRVNMYGAGSKTVHTGGKAGSGFGILTLSDGDYSASGVLVINDNFWPMFGTGGSFSTNGKTVTAKSGVLMNGGVVNINGGTLNVTGGMNVGIAGGLPATVNFTTGTFIADEVIVGTSSPTVNGVFNQTGITSNTATINNLIINNTDISSVYECSGIGSRTINITGNWVNNGTSASFIAGASLVEFKGSAAQTIEGSAVTNFYKLKINNAAGVTLNSSATVNNTLTLTNGLVTTAGTSALTAAGSIAATYGPLSYVNGKLAQVFGSYGTKVYPVGKGGSYRPVTFKYISGGDASTITVEQMEGNIGTPPAPATAFATRYWNISQTGRSTLNYTVTLSDPDFTPIGAYVKILKKESGIISVNDATQTPPDFSNVTGFTTLDGTNSFTLAYDCSSTTIVPAIADFCQGTTSAPLGASYSGTATGVVWSVTPAAAAGGTFSPNANDPNAKWTPPATFNGVATLTLNPTGGLCAPNNAGSNTVTVIEAPSGSFTATENSGIAPDDNIICIGSNVTFTAPPGYNFYNFYRVGASDTLQKGLLNVLNTSSLVDGDQISVYVLNNLGCGTTFGPIVFTVNDLPLPTLTPSKTTICPSESITFTASGNIGDEYNFKVGTSTVQSGTESTYTSDSWADGDIVTVEVTNANKCSATSAPVTITVNPIATGTFTSTASPSNTICEGENVTFTANGGTLYQFSVNTTVVQTFSNTPTFSSTALPNPSIVSVEVKNASGCIATYPAISITVNPLPTGTISVTENSGGQNDFSICANEPVTYTFPTGFKNYDFQVNGVSKQSNSSNTYTNTTLVNGDVVKVIVRSNADCEATFTAPPVTIVPSPSGTLTVSDNTICAGDFVTFTADADPNNTTYNFLVNNVQASIGTGNTFTTDELKDGDEVTVEVTNANDCVTTFNTIIMTVEDLPTGTMSIAENSGIANDGTICAGTEVTFTVPTTFTSYDFRVNGFSAQNNGSNIFSTTTLANGNTVTVVVTNAAGCEAILNSYTITVNPLPAVSPITGVNVVCISKTTQLSNTAGGTWASLNPGIATVDGTGLVTGVSDGTATIVYTTVANGNGCTNSIEEMRYCESFACCEPDYRYFKCLCTQYNYLIKHHFRWKVEQCQPGRCNRG